MKGKFFVFEGPDGCGKTTAFRLVAKNLAESGIKHQLMREPGGKVYLAEDGNLIPCPNQIQESLRKTFLNKYDDTVSAQTEIQIFTALRHQNGKVIIRPALNTGVNVFSDRYVISSMAYQGMRFNEMSPEYVLRQNIAHAKLIRPDVIYFFKLSFEECLRRKAGTGEELDRVESEDLGSKRAVYMGYQLAPNIFSEYYPETKFVMVDAAKPPEEIAKFIANDIFWQLR